MVKKIFALASVSALAGMMSVAGCSSKDEPGGAKPTATPDSGTKETGGPKVTDEGDGGSDPGSNSCLVQDEIDATKFPYTKALKSPGACTTADLDELSKFF